MKKPAKARLSLIAEFPGRFPGERNDCVVRTLTTISGKPYTIVHAALESAGRKWADGFYFDLHSYRNRIPWRHLFDRDNVIHSLSRDDCDALKKRAGGRTFGRLTAVLKSGAFIVSSRNHIAAIVDGVLYDMVDSRRFRVCRIYRIRPRPTTPARGQSEPMNGTQT